jgi:lysozyme
MKIIAVIILFFVNAVALAENTDELAEEEFLVGIDVSHYQGDIKWESLKTSIDFAYIKVSDGEHMVDPNFRVNWTKVQQLKILAGGYHFFEPKADPEYQARLFLKTLKFQQNFGVDMLPPVLDVETILPLDAHGLVIKINKWLQLVESETHCRPILYSNYQFWFSYLMKDFANYKIWIADYNPNFHLPISLRHNVFWQYQQNAMMPGISGVVDKNKFMGNYSELLKLACKRSENNNVLVSADNHAGK